MFDIVFARQCLSINGLLHAFHRLSGQTRPTARKQRLIFFLPVNRYNSHPVSVNHPAKFLQSRSILIELDGRRLKKDLNFTLSP